MPPEDSVERESIRYERTGYFATRVPPQGAEDCTHLLLALHGWGQSARWFARRFHPLGEAPVFVATPQGPHQFYLELENKKVGFNWLTAYERQDNINDANSLFDAVVDMALARIGHPVPVYVLGFSQGSSMAWRYALHAGNRIAGMVSCCADLPPDVAAALPAQSHFRTLLVYGTDDGIVPQAKIEEAQATLKGIGWEYDLLEFEGGHDLPAVAVREIGDWMREALPS
jgi:phospholipase/carboxylesterase